MLGVDGKLVVKRKYFTNIKGLLSSAYVPKFVEPRSWPYIQARILTIAYGLDHFVALQHSLGGLDSRNTRTPTAPLL